MADEDIGDIFDKDSAGGIVEWRATLTKILEKATGIAIEGGAFNDRVKRTGVSVTSHFLPTACDPQKEAAAIPASHGGTSSGEAIAERAHEKIPIASGPHLHPKLVALEHALTDVRVLLQRADGAPAPPAQGHVVAATEKPCCWSYRDTEHGPQGLARASEYLHVKVKGTVDLLGGLKTFNADTSVIMYVEYSVNTYLRGHSAWQIDPATGDPVFNNNVVLDAQRNCGGGADQPCSSDVAVDTLRVVVNFKKVFVMEVGGSGGTPISSATLRASIQQQVEETYTGTVSFSHTMGASST